MTALDAGLKNEINVSFAHGKIRYGENLEVATFADFAGSIRLVSRRPSSPTPPEQSEATYVFLPRLAADPEAGRLYESYTMYRPNASNEALSVYQIAFAARADSVWTTPVTVGGRRSQGARLVVGPEGEVVLVWKDMADMERNQIQGCRSTDGGRSFGVPFTIGDAFDHFQGGSGYFGGEGQSPAPACVSPFVRNYPSLAIDRSHGPHRGTMYVVWSNSIRGNVPPASRVRGEREPNNSEGTATQIELGEDVSGSGRNSDFGTDIDFFFFDGEAGQTVSISGDISARSGAYLRLSCNYGQPGVFPVGGETVIVNGRACEPLLYTLPHTGRYFLSLHGDVPSDFVYTLHVRTLEPDGESPARDIRDVVLSSSSDGGATWTTPRVVNDDPPYYENLLPEVAVDGLGGVHVSWYDRRDDTRCGAGTNVYCRYSQDGGRTFFPSERLSDSTSAMDWAQPHLEPSLHLGEYMALAAEGTDIYAAWTQTGRTQEQNANEHNIHFRHFSVNPDLRLTGGEATSRQGVVRLTWDVTLPDLMWKFRVLRGGAEGGPFALLREVAASERGLSGYEISDSTADANQTVTYRIEGIRADEQLLPPRTVSVQVIPRTATTVWRSVMPNPFSGIVELEINSPGASAAEVRVFDARGAFVRILRQGPILAGVDRLSWDGRGEGGRPLSGGVYFLELSGPGFKDVRKVVRVRRE